MRIPDGHRRSGDRGAVDEDRFVTVIAGILDPRTHDIELVNAGHLPPVLCRPDGSLEIVQTQRGFPVGVLPDSTFISNKIRLKPGESLFFFTDGATDGVNAEGVMFGMERILNCWRKLYPNIEEQGMALIRDIQKFVGKVPHADDICLTGIRRTI